MGESVWLQIATMAGVTYAIRFIPLVLLRRELRNPYLRAFLHYVPYATLTAMTIPSAVLSAPHPLSGVIGLAVAGGCAFKGISLLPTAAAASFAVGIVEYFL